MSDFGGNPTRLLGMCQGGTKFTKLGENIAQNKLSKGLGS